MQAARCAGIGIMALGFRMVPVTYSGNHGGNTWANDHYRNTCAISRDDALATVGHRYKRFNLESALNLYSRSAVVKKNASSTAAVSGASDP